MMAKKKKAIPNYSKVIRNGTEYYRTRVRDSTGKQNTVYGKTPEETYRKACHLRSDLELNDYIAACPTVAEYCEKWLKMQSSYIRPGTLRNYTLTVNKYIVAALGDKHLCDVTTDDIRIAMLPVSKMSSQMYSLVKMLYKSIFSSAEYSRIISHNPANRIPTKGGKPRKESYSLTDEQAKLLLDTIRNLPPYVFVMLGLYAGLRREEILGLQWDCVFLDEDVPYISIKRTWRTVKNRPVITTSLKTPSARRDIPIPPCLVECLKAEKNKSNSSFVISDKDGNPLAESQFVRLWKYITVRSVKPRTLYKYVNGQPIKKTFVPIPGSRSKTNRSLVYCLDFDVTPHVLRHTYITNLIYAGVDPKTVQYLAGHKSSEVTMDIYAKVKYNRPEELFAVVNGALKAGEST